MKKDPLSPQVRARICSHMNTDHPEALLEFARRYGGIVQPLAAKMLDLTSLAMQLEVDEKVIEIYFDHELIDSSDAHTSLVEMLKKPTEASTSQSSE